ncbi:AMP-binding protein, partial [Xanthomonas citri pv. citri]|nr:AMP-binding protein [Xanthomonas citri pv. citri]
MSPAAPLTRIHQLLAQQAGQRPDATFLYEEGGGRLSYAQFWRRVQAAAAWLEEQGVRPGHRVLIAGEN